MPEERFTVENRSAESRYVLLDSEAEHGSAEVGEESYLDYSSDGVDQRIMYHTGVSEQYGGLGLASVLVRAAVEDTIAAGRKIVPVCPYVAAWLPKHPEYAEHVVAKAAEHLEALPSNEG